MNQNTSPDAGSVSVGAIDMSYVEWQPELRGSVPTILLVHATGFHSRIWDEIVEQLEDFHVIAVDQWGHGRSGGAPIKHWKVFGQSLQQLVQSLDLKNILGVGHSMGGHALIEAAAQMENRFQRLVLIDPTVAEPESYERGGNLSFSDDEPHPASKRKNDFANPEEMVDRFRDRVPYSLFTATTLQNYCVYGLEKEPGGDRYRLSCSPAMEASIYMTSRTNGAIYKSVRSIDMPVLIVRAKRSDDQEMWDFTASPTWPGLVKEFRNAREIYRPDRTHFIAMEIPNEVAAMIREG